MNRKTAEKNPDSDKNINSTTCSDEAIVAGFMKEYRLAPYLWLDYALRRLEHEDYEGIEPLLGFATRLSAFYYINSHEEKDFLLAVNLFRELTQCYGKEFRKLMLNSDRE